MGSDVKIHCGAGPGQVDGFAEQLAVPLHVGDVEPGRLDLEALAVEDLAQATEPPLAGSGMEVREPGLFAEPSADVGIAHHPGELARLGVHRPLVRNGDLSATDDLVD